MHELFSNNFLVCYKNGYGEPRSINRQWKSHITQVEPCWNWIKTLPVPEFPGDVVLISYNVPKLGYLVKPYAYTLRHS